MASENIKVREQLTDSIEKNAHLAAEEASERLARDVLLLDLREVSDYMDYFVIATGETARHLEFLAKDITSALRDNGTHIKHREGTGESGWILLDVGGLLIHLFTAEQRESYDLEERWAGAREVLRLE